MSYGELLWDLYPSGPRLGGASANLAFHAARLGCESLLVSRVGSDELGERALRELAEAGVDVSGVGVDETAPTGQVRVELLEGEPRFTIGLTAAWDRIQCSTELTEQIRGADVLCFGTLAQRSPQVRGALGALLDTLDSGPSRGPVRLCDLNLRPPFVDAKLVLMTLERAEILKLNESELSALAALDAAPRALRADPLSWLLSLPRLSSIALTRGSRGARLVTRNGEFDHPGHASSGVDPVGAGDAFTAVLARETCRGTPPELLLDRACRYSAWVASEPGGQPKAPAELLAGLVP